MFQNVSVAPALPALLTKHETAKTGSGHCAFISFRFLRVIHMVHIQLITGRGKGVDRESRRLMVSRLLRRFQQNFLYDLDSGPYRSAYRFASATSPSAKTAL